MKSVQEGSIMFDGWYAIIDQARNEPLHGFTMKLLRRWFTKGDLAPPQLWDSFEMLSQMSRENESTKITTVQYSTSVG